MRSYFSIILLLFTQATTAEVVNQFDFSLSITEGRVEGYVQTPDGGQVGSTDAKRPEFEELEIEEMASYDGEFGWLRGKNRYYIGANFNRSSENTTLATDLKSQDFQFLAGDFVDSDIQLDWYRLGYQRLLASTIPGVSYRVGGDVVLLRFHYELNNGLLKADREYNKVGYRVGGEIAYEVSETFGLNLSVYVPLKFDSTADITTIDATAEFIFSPVFKVIGGASLQRLSFEDQQTFPNNIEADIEPMFRIGMIYNTPN